MVDSLTSNARSRNLFFWPKLGQDKKDKKFFALPDRLAVKFKKSLHILIFDDPKINVLDK